MCVGVYENMHDDDNGTYVSVGACLMKGDNDDSLTWPFTGKVKFELLNQLEDKNHYERTIEFPAEHMASQRVMDSKRGTGYGWPQFIPPNDLDYNADTNCQYLKKDCLVFRVSVKVPDQKPWLDYVN